MSIRVMRLYSDIQPKGSMTNGRGPPMVMPDEPIRARVRPEAMHFYQKDKVSHGIAMALQWLDPPDPEPLPLDTRLRKEHRRKNFISINRNEIKDIAERMKETRNLEEMKKQLEKPLWKSDKPSQNGSTDHAKKPASASVAVNGHRSRRHSASQKRTSGRNSQYDQQIAVVDGTQVVRSQSVEPLELNNGGVANRDFGPLTPRSRSIKQQIAKPSSSKNFIRTNVDLAGRTPMKRSDSAVELNNLKKAQNSLHRHTSGEIPQYIKNRKEHMKKSDVQRFNKDAPAGHIQMDEEERRNTLDSLKRVEADILQRLNTLPIRTDTPFLRRRKQLLLSQLEEVDEAVRIFSRPKVFIKVDQ